MSKTSFRVRAIALGGVLAAMSALLKFLSFETPLSRVTFYDIPTMFAGIILGPVFGGMVGFAADVSKLSIYGPNLMTLSSILWGALPGFIFMIYFYFAKEIKMNYIVLFIAIVITSATCFSINTYQLYLWRGWVVVVAEIPFRIIVAIIKLPIQFFVISLVFNRTKHLVARLF